ncbi:DUF4143 domain-containing protein [uncultured Desulfobacter sp.]|uniref:DUF4143 domain-containing protein n=1 Tax=uncultured Desulfobacter sp. TaxID=240139 RepID=UPI00374856C1
MIVQHLLYRNPSFQEPELFYWCREKRQASSEVDFVIHKGIRIIPVEVKAGKTGTLKSLHVFLKEKKYPEGVRFNITKIKSIQDINRLKALKGKIPSAKSVPELMRSIDN